jgi:hypothetical protein
VAAFGGLLAAPPAPHHEGGIMTAWSTDELDRIGATDELQITTTRPDGSPRRWTPIWVVRTGDDLYVRSYRGAAGGWYRHATRDGRGRVRAGGLDRTVRFEQPGGSTRAAIDEAYRTKYARYGDTYLRPMLAPQATAATLRLVRDDR